MNFAKRIQPNRGSTMVEFVLVFPLILGVILYILEIGIAVNAAQDVAALSRESANLVYRYCVQERGSVQIGSCVQNLLHPEIEALAEGSVDKFDQHNGAVLVSMYRWSVVNGRWEREALDSVWNNEVGKAIPTTRLPSYLTTADLSDTQKQLVAVEAFYDYEPVAIGSGFGIALPDQLHHVTLF